MFCLFTELPDKIPIRGWPIHLPTTQAREAAPYILIGRR